jgi:hypothetical protein
MENETFQNKHTYYEWTDIPNGAKAAIAKYRQFKQAEYNNNPMIQALPPILSKDEFFDLVAKYPLYDSSEKEDESKERFHYVERLSRYFDPLPTTLNLQHEISTLLMGGYLLRNPQKPEYNRRSNEIYSCIQAQDGHHLEDYINTKASAAGATIIGESGLGKSTNLANILDLYPQVIIHPEYTCTQIVWLMVECPPTGSLKGLCGDIFRAIDNLLGTNYSKKFGSSRNSEDNMLGQVAQLAHTYHLGTLVIDEIQNLTNASRKQDDILNFLVRLNNTIGIPVIRVGTSEAEPVLTGKLRNARRGTGTGNGIIRWQRLEQDQTWEFFVKGMWEYQWTKTEIPYSQEISNVLYQETLGIIDIVIKLYKMVQWKAIVNGNDEMITIELIREVAKEGLHLVQGMLDAIRSGDIKKMEKYKDVGPVDISEYRKNCLNQVNFNDLIANRQAKQEELAMSPLLKTVIAELIKLGISASRAKALAEQVVANNPQEDDYSTLVDQAYLLELEGDFSKATQGKTKPKKTKSPPNYVENDIRKIVEDSKANEGFAYDSCVEANVIKDNPQNDF